MARNCEIFMDGKSIQGCTGITFRIQGPDDLAELTLEMVGEIEIQGVLNPDFIYDYDFADPNPEVCARVLEIERVKSELQGRQ